MSKHMRRRLGIAALATVLVLLAGGLGLYLLSPPVLDETDKIAATLIDKDDMPGYSPSPGIAPPKLSPDNPGMDGRQVVMAGKLADKCRDFREDGDGWACDGLLGMGVVGFSDDSNVDRRVSTTIYAYDGTGAAEATWDKLKSETPGDVLEPADDAPPEIGDQRAWFTSGTGRLIVWRTGTVVAQAEVNDAFPGSRPAELADVLKAWSTLQATTIEEALGQPGGAKPEVPQTDVNS